VIFIDLQCEDYVIVQGRDDVIEDLLSGWRRLSAVCGTAHDFGCLLAPCIRDRAVRQVLAARRDRRPQVPCSLWTGDVAGD
jgi:hypothetical protein